MCANPKTASRLPRYTVTNRPRPKRYDHPLRYWVWSRSRPGMKFLVQIDSYNYNGECQCEAFTMNLQKLLRRGITPEAAIDQKLVKLKKDQRPQDALRCPHIIDAMMAWAVDAAKIVINHEKERATKAITETD